MTDKTTELIYAVSVFPLCFDPVQHFMSLSLKKIHLKRVQRFDLKNFIYHPSHAKTPL